MRGLTRGLPPRKRAEWKKPRVPSAVASISRPSRPRAPRHSNTANVESVSKIIYDGPYEAGSYFLAAFTFAHLAR